MAYFKLRDMNRVYAAAQSAEALRYKPEGGFFWFPTGSLRFPFGVILPAALWPCGRLDL